MSDSSSQVKAESQSRGQSEGYMYHVPYWTSSTNRFLVHCIASLTHAAMHLVALIAAFVGWSAFDMPVPGTSKCACSCHAFLAPTSPLIITPSPLAIGNKQQHNEGSNNSRIIRPRQAAMSLNAHGILEVAASNLLLSASGSDPMAQSPPLPSAEALSPATNVAVFVVGLIPFAWATVEFWRRIAVGATFGTGKDSVVIPRPQDVLLDGDGNPLITIGEDANPASSRGRQVLGKDALVVAYLLFGIAAAAVGLSVYGVLTAPPMP